MIYVIIIQNTKVKYVVLQNHNIYFLVIVKFIEIKHFDNLFNYCS